MRITWLSLQHVWLCIGHHVHLLLGRNSCIFGFILWIPRNQNFITLPLRLLLFVYTGLRGRDDRPAAQIGGDSELYSVMIYILIKLGCLQCRASHLVSNCYKGFSNTCTINYLLSEEMFHFKMFQNLFKYVETQGIKKTIFSSQLIYWHSGNQH
jgi:hypothetical protein